MEQLNALFIFVAPGADPDKHISVVDTPGVLLNVVGVSSYDQAEKVAKKYVDEKGVAAIEVCAGFGNEGLARLSKAVRGKAVVGAVRFDLHPGLEFKTGDELF